MRVHVVAAIFLASFCTGAEWDAFKVTYGRNGLGYYDMPWTVKEATAQGKWQKIGEDKGVNVDVYSQPEDPRVMLLFDKKGHIAGIRMAFLKEDIQTKARTGGFPFEFDYETSRMYEKGNFLGKDLYYADVLFASPDRLASGGRDTLNKETGNVAEGIYFKTEGKWTEMSEDECKTDKDFEEANCYPGMGKHYFYQLEKDVECKNKHPFFGLYDQGKLVGFGLGGYGSFSKHPKTQSYYEDFTVNASRSIIRNGPTCIEEFIHKYGLTQMHVFFKKDASKTACPSSDWRSTHC